MQYFPTLLKKSLILTTLGLSVSAIAVDNSVYLPKTSNINNKSSNLAQVGYSFGYMMADGNKETVDDLHLDAFFQGFRDAYTDKKSTLTPEQMKKVLLDYQKAKEAEYARQIEDKARENLAKGTAFLKQNGNKQGIVTTHTGLQYQVLTLGTGKRPTKDDNVKVHYEGRLIDDTIFDSSYKRGEPLVVPLNQVIEGWTQGLQLMNVGSKYRLFVPAKLGYGEAGNADIDPNSVLIFDVELLEINPKTDKKSAKTTNEDVQ